MNKEEILKRHFKALHETDEESAFDGLLLEEMQAHTEVTMKALKHHLVRFQKFRLVSSKALLTHGAIESEVKQYLKTLEE